MPSMTNGRDVSIVQQTGLLTATILAPCASVVVRLSFAILPGVDDVLILGATMLREQVNINGEQGLTTKAICYVAPEAWLRVALHGANAKQLGLLA